MGGELDAIILEMRPGFDFPSKHEHVSSQEPEAGAKAEEKPATPPSDEEDAPEASAEDSSRDEESGQE